jgi:replication factor A1
VTFVDESGEIRATGFNQEVDKFYDLLAEGQVYYVSKCRVNMAKKQFSNVQNDFELMFERDTEIELCVEEVKLPTMQYNFIDLATLEKIEPGATVDVVAIIKAIYDVQTIVSKNTSREFEKRDISLVDQSGYEVKCTLWGKQAAEFQSSYGVHSVVALKGAKVSDFNGKSLTTLQSTVVVADPDVDRAHELKGWYDAQGRNESFSKYEGTSVRRDDSRKTIQSIYDENLGHASKPDYFSTKAAITFVRKKGLTYPSCTNDKCNKKVTQETDGSWRCDRCNVTMSMPNYRYMVTFSMADPTGQMWASSFDDTGREILGRPASEIAAVVDSNDEDRLGEILNSIMYDEYVLRCSARLEEWNNENGLRITIQSAVKVDNATESKRLLEQIALYD